MKQWIVQVQFDPVHRFEKMVDDQFVQFFAPYKGELEVDMERGEEQVPAELLYADTEEAAVLLAKAMAKSYPGQEVTVSNVTRMVICVPQEPKVLEVTKKGILP